MVLSAHPTHTHTTTSLLAQVQNTWLHNGSPPQAWSPNSPGAARTTASHLHAQDCWGANASDTSRCILDAPETKTSDEITQIKLSTDFVSSNQAQNYIRNNGRCYTVPHWHCNIEQLFFFSFFFYKHPFYPITITAWNTVNSDRTKCFKSALLSAKRRQTNNRCAPQPVAPIPDSWMMMTTYAMTETDGSVSNYKTKTPLHHFWGVGNLNTNHA